MEAVPHGGESVHARRAPRRAAALIRHVTEPLIRVLVPTGDRYTEVLCKLKILITYKYLLYYYALYLYK